jgi:hypothetical protein
MKRILLLLATAIHDVHQPMSHAHSDSWHDLNGRKLAKQPTTPGIYLYQGRKIIIR